MCIGPDDGCHEVPDPIAPMDMRLVSLDPTRMPMSFPFITINGPIFIFIPPVSMPGVWPMGLADGLAPGIGMFILGMFAMLCFLALGFFLVVVLFFCVPLLPIFIPGMFRISC